MSTEMKTDLCIEVEEAMASLLDGTASARLFDHVADCDACRDAKHDAMIAGQQVTIAGADFRAPDGFAERLLANIDVERPNGPRSSASSSERRSSGITSSPVASERNDTAVSGALDAKTQFTPFEVSHPTAARPTPIVDDMKTVATPMTIPEEPLLFAAETVEPRRQRVVTSRPADTNKPISSAAASAATPEAPKPIAIAIEKTRRNLSAFKKPIALGAIAATLAAAAAVGLYWRSHHNENKTAIVDGPWSGKVEAVSRASADKTGGFEACNLKGECSVVAADAEIKVGWTVRTDARTRAHVRLADDTEVALDRDSELVLEKGATRSATLTKGSLVADVAHIDGSEAHFKFQGGDVEVVGTKLAITAGDDRASVQVARGEVNIATDGGKKVSVRAGEEATIVKGSDPVIASSSSLADTMEWSDRSPEDVDTPTLRGIGELRARKPGETKEKDRAVRLAKHAAKIRVVDLVARTEIDETFTNDTDEELEGIYRFPLPPGAQIEKLSLEVDGKLQEGAFVDRDRGAAIWRGVIQNAAPKAPKPKDEIFWVPGPWRDPALLEWQRGGRFELKIFPIPKKGSRRVVLSYTQTVDESAGMRRFSYPLVHDASGNTKIGSFDLDVQVLGADKSVPIATRGYELTSASANGDGERRTMHADNFVPAGDLTVEYALPNRDAEVTAWAYTPSPQATATALPAPKNDEEKKAREQANAILDDHSPYVAIALRPKLPHWHEQKERVHAIVVDTSRSMTGERFARATHLASAIVREMDRRDSFVVLACDTKCKPMTSESGGLARPEAPGAAAAGDVEKFLGSIEPDGGSDLAAQIAAARSAVGSTDGKELRVIYLGDGTPSVGATKPAQIEAAVRHALPGGDASVIAVPLGSDADTTSLQAMARGGGGVLVPYVPGERIASAALDVLGAAYGTELRDVKIELPSCRGQAQSCMSEPVPSHLDAIRAGGETLVFARIGGGSETVDGQIKLSGKIAGERFEQSYPIHVAATTNAGNAFVPRLYAAAKIAELEQSGDAVVKPAVIELSKRFGVASRFTSLIVLESEAMFKAFGVDRNHVDDAFSGEDAASSDVSTLAHPDKPDDDDLSSANPYSGDGVTAIRKGGGRAAPAAHAANADTKAKKSAGFFGNDKDDEGADQRPPAGSAPIADEAPADLGKAEEKRPMAQPSATMGPGQFAAPVTPAPPPPPAKIAGGSVFENQGESVVRPNPRRPRWMPQPRRLVPMRKVFDKKARFEAINTLARENAVKLTAAESALNAEPDSRDKTVNLFALYATSGRIGEAQELTARWSGRDALDPEALQARSDLAARQGDRERAVRILGGLADVRPNDRTIQARLADLHDAAGERAEACEYRVSLADLALSDAKLVADAVRCTRELGDQELASQIQLDAGEKVRAAVDRFLTTSPAPAASALRGDVQIAGTWNGNADLDIALIDSNGKRTSWLGSSTKGTVTALDPTSTHDESIAVSGLPQGSYVVEVSRAAGGTDASDTIRGDLTMKLPDGGTQRVPFTLTGARTEVGTVKIFFTARLVPINDF